MNASYVPCFNFSYFNLKRSDQKSWLFEVFYPYSVCSIYSNSGHLGWLAGSLDINLKVHVLRMTQAKWF